MNQLDRLLSSNKIYFNSTNGRVLYTKSKYSVIRKAYLTSRESKASSFKHGAVIHDGKRIIAFSSNYIFKTHPKGSGRFRTVHAEVGAITKALNQRTNLRGLWILILRTNGNGDIRLSKPCPDCMDLINSVGLIAAWSEND